MVSLSPHTGLMFSQKHAATGLPYPTPPSWFGNYMTHHGHHANNQFFNGGQPPIGTTTNGILDTEAPYSAHYHMLQQSSPDWSHDPYGIPTPNSQFYPNGMTPTSMHLSPSNNQQHNTNNTDGSDNNNLHNSLTNIPPSPPTTVNSGCSEMSSPSIGSNGMNNNQIGNGESSPNLPHSDHNNISRSKSPYEWMKKPSYQTQQNPGKTRTKDKYRVVYTDYQRLELEKEYHMSHYITIRRKSELAQSLQLSERQVKIWFQNRRAKDRKQTKKRDVNPSNNSILSNGGSNVPFSLHNHNMSVAGMGYGLDIKPKLEPGLTPGAHHPHNYYGLHHPGHHPHSHPMHQLSSMSMNLLHQNHMQSSVAVSQDALASPTSSAA